MISFLIPTYNFDCTALVHTLSLQANSLKKSSCGSFNYEIIVADDASPCVQYVSCYDILAEWEGCSFVRLDENFGRSKIRNYLASIARFEYLVFIDCDAQICTDDFVQQYWESRHLGDVVCGALRNLPTCPPGGELRYVYEKAAEHQRTVAFRNAQPYKYFTTFNVMFNRKVLTQLLFDERCTEYGYEDALMGVMLEKRGYHVAHIDNPLVHTGIDQSPVYLDKVETSLRVLYRLGEPLHSASSLVRLERHLRHYHLLSLFLYTYIVLRPLLRRNLVSNKPSMAILKIYKLGYYATLSKTAR